MEFQTKSCRLTRATKERKTQHRNEWTYFKRQKKADVSVLAVEKGSVCYLAIRAAHLRALVFAARHALATHVLAREGASHRGRR